MRKTKPIGTVPLPVPTGDLTLTIHVEYESEDFATNAPAAPGNVSVTFSVVGTLGGHTIDLGVRRHNVPVRGLPADLDGLVATEAVAGLIAEYRQRITDLTIQLARLGVATGEGIAVAFTVNDLAFLRHCLMLTELRWREAIQTAEAAAQQPDPDDPPEPGFINIRPTPNGFATAARLFGTELARVEKLTTWAGQLLDLARDAAGDDEDPQ